LLAVDYQLEIRIGRPADLDSVVAFFERSAYAPEPVDERTIALTPPEALDLPLCSSSCQATKTAASSARSTASRASSSSRKSGKPARSRRSRTPARSLRRRFAHESPKGLAPQANPFA
jgi:hypothetical protein